MQVVSNSRAPDARITSMQPLPASKRLLGDGKRNFRFLQKPTKNTCIPGFEADCLKCQKLLKMNTVNIHPPQTKKKLDMLTSYMDYLQNVHQREDLPSMIQNFHEKYSQTMEDMSASCHLPQRTFQQVWEFAQTTAPSRAAGMDA